MSRGLSPHISPIPPWVAWGFVELTREIKEVPGKESNPRILDYHRHTTLKATEDEVPWCSAAMCCCFHEIGIVSTRSAAARSWLGWGTVLPAYQFGAIAIFTRGVGSSSGHVGIAVREKQDKLLILGGNQSDGFTMQWFPKRQLVGFRWPNNYDPHEYYFEEIPEHDNA